MADEEKKGRTIADEMDAVEEEDLGPGPHYLIYGLVGFLVAAALVISLVLTLFTKKVEPWEVGLRYWNFNLMIKDKGDWDPLKPGYRVVLPYLNTFERFDRSAQRIDWPSLNDQNATNEVLRIRTSTDLIEFDVFTTVIYRIDPERVRNINRYYKTMEGVLDKGVRTEFRGRLVAKLSEIKTVSVFHGDAVLVRKKITEAIEEMNREFEDNHRGILIHDVLIHEYRFSTDIEASIISKVVAIQKIEMEKAITGAAQNRAELVRLLAEAEAAYDQERARGLARVKELDAEAESEFNKALAVGQKKVLAARAEGMGKINTALAGRGGSTYVGLESAKALEGLRLIVLPATGKDGLNPLDMDRTIRSIQPGEGRIQGEVSP